MHTRTVSIGALALLLLAGSTLPVFAETTSSTTPIKKGGKSLDLPCVQSAVDTREGAIGTAFTAFSTAQSAALATRKSALHDAWGMTDDTARRAARNKAWNDYHEATKAAHATLRAARKATWKAFDAASASCKVPVVEVAKEEGVGSLGL